MLSSNMAESFLFSIATTVLEKIAPLVAEQASSVFKSDLKELQRTMSDITASLLHAENQQNQDERLRLCMRNLRDIFYDAEDVLDLFHCKALRREIGENPSISKRVRFCTAMSFDSFPPVFSLKMGLKIKDIKERLAKVYAEWNKFNLGVGGDNRRVIGRERETHSFVNDSDVIGRAEDKEEIVRRLMKEEPTETRNIPVIPIVGIGGLGKTLLTQLVYNDERVVRLFPSRIWVCVSEEFDLHRLLKDIIHSITRNKVDDSSLDTLQTKLREHLKDKRFLLVLDDVWNEDRAKWEQLRNSLSLLTSSPGSKIIVTTRMVKVASIMTSNRPYELRGLPHEDCMTLFTRWAFNDGDDGRRYPNLMQIGEQIVRKCQGIPLAVRTLGSLLFLKTEEREWMSIRDSEIWTLEQKEGDILPVLKLSYDHLPSCLQRCLAFLPLFRKGYSYHGDDIISLWMANGLLENPNQNEEWEDVGSRYLKELWSRCFIQDFCDEGFYSTFRMHDLIHDLASSVSQNDCTTLHNPSADFDEKIRHVSFCQDQHSIDSAQVLKRLPKRVRTVVVQVGRRKVIDSISNFKYLRMLDLHDSSIDDLPDSIGKLKHLRYLDLRRCRGITKLPASFYKLRSLLFLKMSGVSLKHWPDSMRGLISLRSLEITVEGSSLEEILPGCWSCLQYLGVFFCYNLQCLFDGMQHLTSLRTLHLNTCSELKSLPRSLKFLTKLENLEIHECRDFNLQMEPEEEDRQIRLSLKTFSIWRLPASKDLPRLLLEGSSSTLQRIKIDECNSFEALPAWLQNLTALKQLYIKNCPILSERCRRDGGADYPKIAHIQDVTLI